MREGRLGNAKARKHCTRPLYASGRLDIKILGRIRRRERRRRKVRADFFKGDGRSCPRLRFFATATGGNSTDSARTLSQCARSALVRSISFDVRICLLLIKAYQREDPEYIVPVVSSERNVRPAGERINVAAFRKNDYSRCRWYSVPPPTCCRDALHESSSFRYVSVRIGKGRSPCQFSIFATASSETWSVDCSRLCSVRFAGLERRNYTPPFTSMYTIVNNFRDEIAGLCRQPPLRERERERERCRGR